MLTMLASTCLATGSPAALLDANRAAMAAPANGTLVQSYSYKSEGMTGAASSLIDLASGRYVEHQQAGLSTDAEGFDGTTNWMKDLSNFYSTQEGGNKPAVAINRAYRHANRWWRADRGSAAIKPIDCNSIEVTPQGGEPFQASFDPKTHLLTKVHEQEAWGTQRDVLYADYRHCGRALVPGRIEKIDNSDPASTQTLTLEKCALAPAKGPGAYAMPATQPHDWSLPPTGRTTVAMRPHDTEVMIQARINGKGPYLFYLDSGGHDILSPRLAHELGLKVEGSGQSGGAGENTVESGYAKVASIDVGGAVLKNQTVNIIETSPPQIVGELIGGIIGVQFFERFVTSIDYEKNTVTFEDPAHFSAAERQAAGTPVPFNFYDHMPQVAGTFDGIPALYNIDTGSGQFVSMTRPFVERTGLRARYPNAVTMVDGFGTGGPSHATIVRAKTLTLGPAEVTHVAASLSTAQHGSFGDPAYGGNVGNGVLRHFRVTFDYPHQTMYLARVAHPDLSEYGFSRSGIIGIPDNGRLKVLDASAGTPAAEAGIKPGDLIISIGAVDISHQSLRETKRLLKQLPVGQPIPITFEREGVRETVNLTPRDLVPE